MSRIIIPKLFLEQQQLFNTIVTKDSTDGTGSAIRPYLMENNIVLANDQTAAADAATRDAKHKEFTAKKENHRQLRDNHFVPVFDNMKMGAQYLKKLYGKNFLKLSEWGFRVSGSGKIIYPGDVAQRMALFNLYYAKHISFTSPPSPLLPFLAANEINMTTDNTVANTATSNNTSFKSFAKKSEKQTELRNKLWSPVMEHVKGIGQFLIKLYSKNPKALSDWGFVIDHSKRKPKEVTTTVKPLAQVTKGGIVVGSTLTNSGITALIIYKGKTTKGESVAIQPGKEFKIGKGFSIITVVNKSALKRGSFKFMRGR